MQRVEFMYDHHVDHLFDLLGIKEVAGDIEVQAAVPEPGSVLDRYARDLPLVGRDRLAAVHGSREQLLEGLYAVDESGQRRGAERGAGLAHLEGVVLGRERFIDPEAEATLFGGGRIGHFGLRAGHLGHACREVGHDGARGLVHLLVGGECGAGHGEGARAGGQVVGVGDQLVGVGHFGAAASEQQARERQYGEFFHGVLFKRLILYAKFVFFSEIPNKVGRFFRWTGPSSFPVRFRRSACGATGVSRLCAREFLLPLSPV